MRGIPDGQNAHILEYRIEELRSKLIHYSSGTASLKPGLYDWPLTGLLIRFFHLRRDRFLLIIINTENSMSPSPPPSHVEFSNLDMMTSRETCIPERNFLTSSKRAYSHSPSTHQTVKNFCCSIRKTMTQNPCNNVRVQQVDRMQWLRSLHSMRLWGEDGS